MMFAAVVVLTLQPFKFQELMFFVQFHFLNSFTAAHMHDVRHGFAWSHQYFIAVVYVFYLINNQKVQ